MPVRRIRLSPEQDALVDEMLQGGEYQDASDVVGDALHALRRRRKEDTLRRERLSVAVRQGVTALDRGEFTELEDDELDGFLDDLTISSTP